MIIPHRAFDHHQPPHLNGTSINKPTTTPPTPTPPDSTRKTLVMNQHNQHHHHHRNHPRDQQITGSPLDAPADCTIACDKGHITAHKLVLCDHSKYLQDILSKFPTADHPIIILTELNITDVKVLVNYMYTGELVITTDSSPTSLLRAAQILKIDSLTADDELHDDDDDDDDRCDEDEDEDIGAIGASGISNNNNNNNINSINNHNINNNSNNHSNNINANNCMNDNNNYKLILKNDSLTADDEMHDDRDDDEDDDDDDDDDDDAIDGTSGNNQDDCMDDNSRLINSIKNIYNLEQFLEATASPPSPPSPSPQQHQLQQHQHHQLQQHQLQQQLQPLSLVGGSSVQNSKIRCHLCNIGLSDVKCLYRHVLTRHLPEKWGYKCEFCDREFSRDDHLMRHYTTKHKNMEFNREKIRETRRLNREMAKNFHDQISTN